MQYNWIKTHLQHIGKKQVELARYLNLQPDKLTKIIHGTRNPTPAELHLIASFFHLTIAEVYELSGLTGAQLDQLNESDSMGFQPPPAVSSSHHRPAEKPSQQDLADVIADALFLAMEIAPDATKAQLRQAATAAAHHAHNERAPMTEHLVKHYLEIYT